MDQPFDDGPRIHLCGPRGQRLTITLAARRTEVGRSPRCGICLDDPSGRMSRVHLLVERRGRRVLVHDRSRHGAQLDGRPIAEGGAALAAGAEVAFAGWRLRLQDTLAPSSVTLGPRPAAVELMGDSEPMERLREQVERVSASGLPVLIQGETGTGKELVARSVHRSSGRRGPFVPINCGALSPQLAESELFGHERGAFTGADRARDGAFARADRGTVFLDELGELPLALQAKLLRVLQERAVRRVGGDRVQPVDFRLVCATHRDLRAMVGSGKFREDLWFRVAVGTLDVPPLRERGADVLQLARHFLQAVGGRADWLDAEARKHLVTHPWPGNVRELKNAIERAVVLGSGPLRPEDLHLGQPLPREREPQDVPRLPPPRRRRALQVRDVVAALERSGGNRAAAARELGIARSTLYERLQAMREREE